VYTNAVAESLSGFTITADAASGVADAAAVSASVRIVFRVVMVGSFDAMDCWPRVGEDARFGLACWSRYLAIADGSVTYSLQLGHRQRE
jgi:hypothetical protein